MNSLFCKSESFTVWLTLHERRLLVGYYHLIGEVDEEAAYYLSGLSPVLKTYSPCHQILQYGEGATDQPTNSAEELKKQINELIESSRIVRHANNLLAQRNLIETKDHSSQNDVVIVSLTIDGYDLGRKYSSFYVRTGLCFSEYKNHWIVLVLGFLAGLLGSLVFKTLERVLFR